MERASALAAGFQPSVRTRRNRGSQPAVPSQQPGRAMIWEHGGLAQLGERLAGSQKVRGSSPLSSTPPMRRVLRDVANTRSPASIRRRFAAMLAPENWTNPTRDSTQSRGPVFFLVRYTCPGAVRRRCGPSGPRVRRFRRHCFGKSFAQGQQASKRRETIGISHVMLQPPMRPSAELPPEKRSGGYGGWCKLRPRTDAPGAVRRRRRASHHNHPMEVEIGGARCARVIATQHL